MRARGSGEWPNDAWTAAVYAADRDAPLGAGVVIDDRRVLTCRHVIEPAHGRGAALLVRFPKAGVPRTVACRVEMVRRAKEDVVVLQLAEPVPPEVTSAVLRAPSWVRTPTVSSVPRCPGAGSGWTRARAMW
jgi:hypothetical protein